mgnify:CR=1 FL=1
MPSTTEFIEKAFKIAMNSPDPFKKVGVLGVTKSGKQVAWGYNDIMGLRKGDDFWADRDGRRKFMVHAEINMIAMAESTESEIHNIHTVYITLFPCVHCMTALAALGVKRIIYAEMYDKDQPAIEVALFYGIDIKEYGTKEI